MLPRVGAGKKANVFYNTGHGHLGWTLSAITAHQLAGHVLAWSHVKSSIAGPTRLAKA
jgi:D-amino-acid dehydrogenase